VSGPTNCVATSAPAWARMAATTAAAGVATGSRGTARPPAHRPYGFAIVMNVSLNPSGSLIENVRMPQPSCGS